MKTLITFIFILILTTASGGLKQAQAHGGEDHEMGSHGGKIVEMPPYDVEIQVMDGMIHLFLTDAQKAAVPVKDITGKLIIQFPDGHKQEALVSIMGNALMVNADVKQGAPFVAVWNLMIHGKAYTARYAHHATQLSGEHGHQH